MLLKQPRYPLFQSRNNFYPASCFYPCCHHSAFKCSFTCLYPDSCTSPFRIAASIGIVMLLLLWDSRKTYTGIPGFNSLFRLGIDTLIRLILVEGLSSGLEKSIFPWIILLFDPESGQMRSLFYWLRIVGKNMLVLLPTRSINRQGLQGYPLLLYKPPSVMRRSVMYPEAVL